MVVLVVLMRIDYRGSVEIEGLGRTFFNNLGSDDVVLGQAVVMEIVRNGWILEVF